jgi:hypothetical protein
MEEQPYNDGFSRFHTEAMQKLTDEFGYTANPFLSIRKNAEIQQRQAPFHERTMTNLTCHNLCTTTFIRPSDIKLIGLGLNFCVTPIPPTLPDFKRFKRSVRIQHQFAGSENADYNPKLAAPADSEFKPKTAADCIEDALTTFEAHLRQLHVATQNPKLNKPNLPPAQLKRLDEIREDKRIIVIPTDKNLGPAILDRSDYIERCLNEHLLNTDNYTQLNEAEASRRRDQTVRRLKELTVWNKSIFPPNSPAYEYFMRSIYATSTRRPPQFYMMPKIHKIPTKNRPVISCIGALLETASIYIDYQLQRVIKLCPCYLRDGWQLLQELKDLGPLPAGARLVTADAVSMYSNIHTDHGVATIRSWLTRHSSDDEFPADLKSPAMIENLCDLLQLVMTNNIFDFDDTTWLQKTGTAMGTSAACAYATIYYSEHEEREILKLNPITDRNDLGIMFYKRFIDDAFIIMLTQDNPERFPKLQQTMNSFGKEGHRLEWTTEQPSKTVNFLDLTISIGVDGRISTKTFQKKMNLFLYIPPISSHSDTVLYGLIFGQLRRFWLQNTHTDDYIRCASAFQQNLVARGHDTEEVSKLFRLAAASYNQQAKHKRATLTDSTSHERVFLHMDFHPRQIARTEIQRVFRNVCAKSFRETTNQALYPTGIEQLTIAHHRPPNLRDLLCSTKMVQPENERVSDHIKHLEATAAAARLNSP